METDALLRLMEQGFLHLNQRLDDQRELALSRHEENVDSLTAIQVETRRINGQIGLAHERIAKHAEQLHTLFTRRKDDGARDDDDARLKLSDLKWYFICAGAGAGAVLWILKLIGKLP